MGYFEKAISLGEDHVEPYLFLSYSRLCEGRFQEAIELCRDGLERTSSTEHLSRLHNWLAIALHALGTPPEEVRRHFDVAVQLGPLTGLSPRERPRFEPSPAPDPWVAFRRIEREVVEATSSVAA